MALNNWSPKEPATPAALKIITKAKAAKTTTAMPRLVSGDKFSFGALKPFSSLSCYLFLLLGIVFNVILSERSESKDPLKLIVYKFKGFLTSFGMTLNLKLTSASLF